MHLLSYLGAWQGLLRSDRHDHTLHCDYYDLMPRRIPDYADAYAGWNYVSSMGSIISVGATALFLYVVYDSLSAGVKADDAAWNVPAFFVDGESYVTATPSSPTTEWVLPSPTPMHAFMSLPVQS